MDKYQLFMIDFCYFVNASGMCQQKSIRVSVSHCISNVRKIWFQSMLRLRYRYRINCYPWHCMFEAEGRGKKEDEGKGRREEGIESERSEIEREKNGE